jgi:iron complex transport system substrate-binding protein
MRTRSHSTPSHLIRAKGFLHLSAALLSVLLVVGCQVGSTTTPSPAATAPQTPTVTETPTSAPTPTLEPTATATATATPHYPLTLTDDEGTTITLPDEPDAVVSLTPATTELLFALGAGDKLVGRTDFDDYPPEVVEVPAVASFTGVLIEQVVDLEPDLVIAGGNNFTPAGDVDRLRDLGLPVLVVYAPDMAGVLADVLLVGQAVGAESEAESVVGELQARIDEVSAAVAVLERPRVFYEIGYEPEIYGPAPESFVADMVNLAGGEPITTTDPAVFSISLERLVDLNPEVIVLGDAAYGVCPTNVVIRPGWTQIAAVSDGNVRPVDDIIVTRPGPRIGEGLAALALAIHPEANVEPVADAVELCPELGSV